MKVKRFDYTAYLKGPQQMCIKLFSTVTSQSTLETQQTRAHLRITSLSKPSFGFVDN